MLFFNHLAKNYDKKVRYFGNVWCFRIYYNAVYQMEHQKKLHT